MINIREQQRIVGYLDGLTGQAAALARPDRIGANLQSETAAELDPLLPSDRVQGSDAGAAGASGQAQVAGRYHPRQGI